MADRKRGTTAPLTGEEVAEALYEIPEEEFLARFDDIFAETAPDAERVAGLVTLDDYMEAELREMFQSIIAQYLRPIASAVERVRGGDTTKRTAQEGLDALAPIVSAAESLEYADVVAELKRIEGPLAELARGAKRRLGKRELGELGAAWERVESRLRPDGDRDRPTTAPLSLAGLTRLEGVTGAHVRSLHGAGLSTLDDLAGAPLDDLVAVSGLPDPVAERVRAYAVGATTVAAASAATPSRRQPAAVPAGWVRVRVESETFRGTFTFEASRLGHFLQPVLDRLAATEPAPPATKPAPRARRAKPAEKKRAK
jgi:hypothetical protein